MEPTLLLCYQTVGLHCLTKMMHQNSKYHNGKFIVYFLSLYRTICVRAVRKAQYLLSSDVTHNVPTSIAGAAESASVKQIIHMSSASCFSCSWSPVRHLCRHGRQGSSSFTPPHRWPQDRTLLHAVLAYSCARKKIVYHYYIHVDVWRKYFRFISVH